MRRLGALLASPPCAVVGGRLRRTRPRQPGGAAPGRARPRPRPPLGRPTPSPSSCPRDDAPHDRLTEWWYDTGHLRAADGRRFGFEYVVFRAERGGFPVSWASHLALTDETGGAFHYAQRSEIGPQVDRSPRRRRRRHAEFTFAARPATGRDGTPWSMAGGDGTTTCGRWRRATRSAGDPVDAFGLDLPLDAPQAAGRSTTATAGSTSARRAARTTTRGPTWPRRGRSRSGDETLAVDGRRLVRPPVGRLHLGRRRRLGLVRGQPRRRHGPHAVARPGGRRHVPAGLRDARRRRTARRATSTRDAFTVDVTDRWTSPATGATYPAGWTVALPGEGLEIDLRPTVAPAGARHAGDDRRRLLGGLAGRDGDPRRPAAGRRGATSS